MTPDARRRQALAACGLDPDLPMVRVASYANEVWIGEAVVLRINVRGVGRLAREARIARCLPRAALHPGILAVGDDGSTEWSLAPRIAGVDLGRAWRTLTDAERERATFELAAALAAVHSVSIDGIPDDIEPPHTLPLAPLLRLVDRVAAKHGDHPVLPAIRDFIRARWDAFDAQGIGLVHGDPHLENVLWDGTHVSALLDFEWSRGSWVHCDLEILLAVAEDPKLFASADHEDTVDAHAYAEVPRWLRAAYPTWFAHPRTDDRLAVLRASRALGHLIETDSSIRWRELEAILAR
jgi:aminoglycoside phosphotransferase (APT) family kinase protein